jgi:hypothetical protein
MTESNQIESNEIVSETFKIRPRDGRCRYWAKVVRAGSPLPMPGSVDGANDIPGAYLRSGSEVELFPGDLLFEGEANHHTKQRGWTYDLRTVRGKISEKGNYRYFLGFTAEIKGWVKLLVREGKIEKSVGVELLKGAGDCAAMVRRAHLERMGWDRTTIPALEAEIATRNV